MAKLGDLLLQVVFHARMAEEAGAFDFDQVAGGIVEKMIRRHPHVFADEAVADAEAQTRAWEAHKQQEREAAGQAGLLDDIALALPALLRAQKMGKRAARVGFDWPDAAGAREKIQEELAELERAETGGDAEAIAEEMGDLLFAVTNLARKLDVNAEEALRAASLKFSRRFRYVEAQVAAAGGDWTAFPLARLDAFWEAAKRAEDESPD